MFCNEIGVAQIMTVSVRMRLTVWHAHIRKDTELVLLMEEKTLPRKKTVNIRYNLGFERMVRAAILQFREMGLEPVIYRHATHAVNKRGNAWIGFVGGNAKSAV